jgi:hypothetical protein
MSIVLGILGCGFAVVVTSYAIHLRHSAEALISAAGQVNSTADAERQIQIWRQKAGKFSESRSPDGLGRAYLFELSNSLLSSLHLVPSTGLSMQLSTRSGELDQVLLGMYTEESSVWIQEDFTSALHNKLHIDVENNKTGELNKAVVMFGRPVSMQLRQRTFALNANCLTTYRGCQTVSQMHSGIATLRDVDLAGNQK